MTSSTEEILSEIYPLIQSKADDSLPEFGFRRVGNGWEATQGELNGTSAQGHIYIYDDTPFTLVDNKSGTNTSVWEYVKTTRGLSENREILRELARMAGYPLPDLSPSPRNMEREEKARVQRGIISDYLVWTQGLLFQPEGAPTLDYLRGRGYSDAEIRKMGLGHNPGWERALEYLSSKGYTRDQVSGSLKWLRARDSHTVVIPQRDPRGEVTGLWGRIVGETTGDQGKYMPLSDGSGIGSSPFGIETCRGLRTAYCVEGIFDCLTPISKGLVGILGWGRTSPARGQLATLKGMGIRSLVFIPDNDDEGRKGCEQSIRAASAAGFNVYVVELPEGVKDLDEFFRTRGVDDFEDLTANPMSAPRWMGNRILEKHDLASDTGEREALDEIVDYEGTIDDPLGRKHFKAAVGEGLRLPEKTLDDLFLNHRRNLRDRKARERLGHLGKLLLTPDDRSVLDIRSDIEAALATITLTEITTPSPFDPREQIDSIINLPGCVSTGYPTLDKYTSLWIPSVNVVAARVGHGKTTFVCNIIRQMLDLEENEGKPFVLVSLEVPPNRLFCRMIGAEIGMEWVEVMRQINTRIMEAAVMGAIEKYHRYFEEERFYVLSDRGVGVDQIREQTLRIREKRGEMGLVAFDYLGLLAGQEPGGDNVEQKYASAMTKVTDLSRELECPILLIAQINREADKGKNQDSRVPRPSQLRYSGQIEQDADAIWGLFNVTYDDELGENRVSGRQDDGRSDELSTRPTEAQLTLLSLKDRYGAGFRPIDFRMIKGVRIEEWDEPEGVIAGGWASDPFGDEDPTEPSNESGGSDEQTTINL